MSSYQLPYDLEAIEDWRSDIRRLAARIDRATATAARQGGAHIEFQGPAADRYDAHLSRQVAEARVAARHLSALNAQIEAVISEAALINKAYVLAKEAEDRARRAAGAS